MVNGANPLMGTDSTKGTTGASSSTNKGSSVSFDKVMSASISAGAKNQTQAGMQNANSIKQTSDSKAVVNNTKDSKQTTTDKTDKPDETVSNIDETKDTELDDKLNELVDDIREKIKEIFGVSDEEIEEAIASLGIVMADILQPDKLTQLVAAVNGQEDSLSILVNEDLSSGLQELLSFVNEQVSQAAESMNISTEDMNQVIKDFAAGQSQENNTEQTAEVQTVPETTIEKLPQEAAKTAEDTTDSMVDVIESKLEVVTGNTPSNSNSSQMDKHGTKNQGANEPVASDMAQSITETFSQVFVDTDTQVSAVEIVRQVVDVVKLTASQQLQSIEIQLNPENLGKVMMTVSAKNGMITAQLVAENEQVKKALENQMVTLKENFNNQGIKVEAIEVTVQSHSFEANENLKGNDSEEQKNDKQSSRHLKLDSLDDLDESELSNEEIRARDSINNGVSSVEYSA